MSSEERELRAGGVIDVEALLSPVAGENPAGESLRYDSTFKEIDAARRADDNLSQGAWAHERKVPDWSRVVALTREALAARSKDLRLAAWLAEALAQLHGLAGVRDGLRVLRGLQLNFWEGLFPESDGDDFEARANALLWLDRRLALALKGVVLTDEAGGDGYTFGDWEDSQRFNIPPSLDGLDTVERERVNALRLKAAEENKINSEQWRAAVEATPRPFYETAFAALDDCWAEFQALDAVTDEKFGKQTPGMPLLRGALEEMRALVGRIVVRKRELEPDALADAAARPPAEEAEARDDGRSGATAAPPKVSSAAPRVRAGGGAAGVSSRAEAYRKLAEAAAYFREAEPHSPVSYLVERAIRWGRMPLEEWLAEVVKNDDVLFSLQETLGVSHRPDDADDPGGDDQG